jgi:hypothetical protein
LTDNAENEGPPGLASAKGLVDPGECYGRFNVCRSYRWTCGSAGGGRGDFHRLWSGGRPDRFLEFVELVWEQLGHRRQGGYFEPGRLVEGLRIGNVLDIEGNQDVVLVKWRGRYRRCQAPLENHRGQVRGSSITAHGLAPAVVHVYELASGLDGFVQGIGNGNEQGIGNEQGDLG